jgi:hypothetical protein
MVMPASKNSASKPTQDLKPVAPKRMSLAAVTKGKLDVPRRILIYGQQGVGKTLWAKGAEAPIYLPVEQGTEEYDLTRLPQPETWHDILDGIDVLLEGEHQHRTLVIDTLDAAEPLCWRHICERDKKDSIEDYGYGKGYVAATDEWRVLLHKLERLRRERGMNVILVAHSWIKTFKNPTGEDFDRYELKLHSKAGGMLMDWCDAVLFAHYETYVSEKENSDRVRGVSSGARIISTQRTAAWDAKNRYSLPETLPLNYDDFAQAVKAARPKDPSVLLASIERKLTELAQPDTEAKVREHLKASREDAEMLARIDDRLSVLINEKEKANV